MVNLYDVIIHYVMANLYDVVINYVLIEWSETTFLTDTTENREPRIISEL